MSLFNPALLLSKLKISVIFFPLLLLLALPAYATSYTWTGADSNIWGTAANWDPSGVPLG